MIRSIEQLYGRIYSIARQHGPINVKKVNVNGEKLTCVYVNGNCDENKLRHACFGQVIDRLGNGRIRIAVVIN